MNLNESADRLAKDIQYLVDSSYVNDGGAITLPGPSVKVLVQSLSLTLAELRGLADASERAPGPVDAIIDRIRKNQAEAQARLNEQAATSAEKMQTLADRATAPANTGGSESPAENPTSPGSGTI